MDRHDLDPNHMARRDTLQGQSLQDVPREPGGQGHVIRVAAAREELDAYADVWTTVHPDTPLSGAAPLLEVEKELA